MHDYIERGGGEIKSVNSTCKQSADVWVIYCFQDITERRVRQGTRPREEREVRGREGDVWGESSEKKDRCAGCNPGTRRYVVPRVVARWRISNSYLWGEMIKMR